MTKSPGNIRYCPCLFGVHRSLCHLLQMLPAERRFPRPPWQVGGARNGISECRWRRIYERQWRVRKLDWSGWTSARRRWWGWLVERWWYGDGINMKTEARSLIFNMLGVSWEGGFSNLMSLSFFFNPRTNRPRFPVTWVYIVRIALEQGVGPKFQDVKRF